MARNGSGTYSKINTFVSGNTITAAGHNQNWDDLVTEMTNSVAADGQTTMTNPIKGSNGAVATPTYSFASDPDTGVYRIGANNLGISVGGTKVFDIATATVSMSGIFIPTALGTGIVATAALADGSVTPVKMAAATRPSAVGMINGTLVESHTGNAVTFEVRTLAGTAPTSTDTTFLIFRNVTAGTGDYAVVTVTTTLSLTISSGSTMGFTSASPGRLWIGAINNAGVAELFAINCLSGTNIYPLQGWGIITTTTEGGAGGADSAQVPYSITGRSAKAYVPLGYAAWEAGGTLGTAGTWNASPTRIQLIDPTVPLPGREVQRQQNFTGASATGTTTIPSDDTIPQITEGDQYLSQAITPVSSANILSVSLLANLTSDTTGAGYIALFNTDLHSTNAQAAGGVAFNVAGRVNGVTLYFAAKATVLTSTTYKFRAGNSTSNTITFNGTGSGRLLGGAMGSYMSVSEIMA